jgi:Family of unknown function (DUF5677)
MDLDLPLAILCRVLCEDFINLYWATQSAENAEFYSKSSLREMGKATLIAIARMIEYKKLKGEPVNTNVEPFKKMTPNIKPKSLAQMAKEAKLDLLYDHVYRSLSLEIHGNNWGTFQIDLKNQALLVLSYISNFLYLTIALLDHGHTVITPKVVLEEFGLESA